MIIAGRKFFNIKEVKMKKPIDAKRVFAAIFIITIVLLTIPAGSFGWDGCVFSRSGKIEGLVFPFADAEAGVEGLELDLNPDPENPTIPVFVVTDVEVKGSGNEKSYITPFNQFIYRTKLVDGWCNLKKGRIIAYLVEPVTINGDVFDRLIFKFNKVRLFETYHISKGAADDACQTDTEPDVPEDPTKVKMYFEAKKAKLINIPGVTAKFNILLILKRGVPDLFIKPIP